MSDAPPPSAPPSQPGNLRASAGPPRRLQAWLRRPEIWPLAALACLLIWNAVFTPNFATLEIREGRLFGPIIDIVHRAAPVGLLSVGMTLVIATGGIDLSVGAVMAVAAAVTALIATRGPVHPAALIAAAVAAAGAAGLWNGALVAFVRIQPIVATLILMVAGRGLAQLLTAGQIITFHHAGLESFTSGSLLGLPSTFFVFAGLLALTGLAVRGTVVGLQIEATGGNETAARSSGVPVARIKTLVYVFSGLCAGLAGVLAAGDIKAGDANNIGLYAELDAILAAVIGGTSLAGGRFYLAGAALGALLIQTLTTMILMRGVGIEYTLVVKALIVVAVCMVQSGRVRKIVQGRIAALRRAV